MINKDTLLSDVVLDEPLVVTVLNRFGITLGLGDATVDDICRQYRLDLHFFTTILNTYCYRDYFPEKTLSAFSVEMLIDYLNKTNAYYEHFQLPNIDRHFSFLLSKSNAEETNLAVIKKFFDEVKNQLLERIKYDRSDWFPKLISLASGEEVRQADGYSAPSTDDVDSVESKFEDLMNMIVIHLKGKYDINLALAVLLAVSQLLSDIRKNNRIRERVLRPLSIQLQNSIK